jgi:hypothetical protein
MEIKISTYGNSNIAKEIVKNYNSFSGYNYTTYSPDFIHFYEDIKLAKRDFNRVYRLYKDKGAILNDEKTIFYKEVFIKLFVG